MIEGAYAAPNSWTLEWRTFCDDDCQLQPRPEVCRDCPHEVGAIRCVDAEGVPQWNVSGVITQRRIDLVIAALKKQATEMQLLLWDIPV